MFVGKAIEPCGGFDPVAMSHGEPGLPPEFAFDGDRLVVASLLRQWRSTKEDRGDRYLKRHWYEILTADGRIAVLYFDRGARRGDARWFLYTIEVSSSSTGDSESVSDAPLPRPDA